MKQRGSILIITLWVTILLSVLAVSIGHRMSLSLKLSIYGLERAQARRLAAAGVERVIAELGKDETKDRDAFNDSWANSEASFKDVSLGAGRFTVSHQPTAKVTLYGAADESARINLNTMPSDVLEKLPGMTPKLASYLIDWRDTDRTGDAEKAYYEGRDLPNMPKNAPFQAVEEILQVREITPAIFKGLAPFVTIYGDGRVNLNTARKEILSALGISGPLADKILAFRDGPDGLPGTEDDQPFKALADVPVRVGLTVEENLQYNGVVSRNFLSVVSSAVRVSSVGSLPLRKTSRAVTCVVQKATSKKPQILYWNE